MKKLLIAALAFTTLATSMPAFAQPNDHRGGPPQMGRGDRDDHRGPPGRGWDRDDRRGDRHDHRGPPRHYRDDGRRDWGGPRYTVERYNPPPRYQARRWQRGERLPPAYRQGAYVVDYNRYNLAPPPRGYNYVRVDNDVVLAAVATGVITSVIAGLLYQ